jgi:hypothetical protein
VDQAQHDRSGQERVQLAPDTFGLAAAGKPRLLLDIRPDLEDVLSVGPFVPVSASVRTRANQRVRGSRSQATTRSSFAGKWR